MIQVNNKNKKGLFIAFSTIFLVGMLLCSFSTTPVFPDTYGGDSALFLLLGKGIVNGKTLYVDLFDHKGPLLFFIEALGYQIGGYTGVFVLQCVSGIINLYFMCKIWDLISKKYGNTSVLGLCVTFLCVYAFLFVTIEGGNLSEEFSLPFITICCYLFVKYAFACCENPEHPYTYALFYGIAFACMAFMRINNAMTVVAGALAIFCNLVYNKKIKNILLNIFFGLTGCLIGALPFFAYFIRKDALWDMIYATFLYNFKYASRIGAGSLLTNPINTFLKFFAIVISIVVIVSNLLKTKKEKSKMTFLDFLITVIVAANVLLLFIVNQYLHYFLLYVPVLLIVLTRYWKIDENKFKTTGVIFCIAVYAFSLSYTFLSNVNSNYISRTAYEKTVAIKEITNKIPEDERDSVLGFEIPSEYYVRADIVPCYKYYTYQQWWSKNDPSIMEEYLEFVDKEKPKWLLVNPGMCDKEMKDFILERYDNVDKNKYMYLFCLKEGE